MNKKGVAWEQIFKAIIMVLVLVTIFLIFFGGIKGPKETLAEGIANIVNKAKDVFKVLQEPTTASDVTSKKFSKLSESERDKILSQTRDKADNIGCNKDKFVSYIVLHNDRIKICKETKDSMACESAIPESYFKIAECYRTVDNCKEAVNYYTKLINNYKDSSLLDAAKKNLAECYLKLGQRDKAAEILAELGEPEFAELGKAKELGEKIGKDPEKVYRSALINFNKGNYQVTARDLTGLISDLRGVKDSELKDPKLKRELLLASAYWAKKAEFMDKELNCKSLEEGYSLHTRDENKNLEFPISRTTYFSEPIIARMYFDVANCFIDEGKERDWKRIYLLILETYRRQDSIPVIIEGMKDKIMAKGDCGSFDKDAPSCNTLNSWIKVGELGPNAKNFRCWWKDGSESPWAKEQDRNKCISCVEININSCQQYGDAFYGWRTSSTCKDDPCGFNCLHPSGRFTSRGCVPKP